MQNVVLSGFSSTAVGAVSMYAVQYADMALRGRAPSAMPMTVAKQLGERLNIDALAPIGDSEPDRTKTNRRSGVGELLGLGTALPLGIGFCALRDRLPAVPSLVAGAALGLAAMTVTNVATASLRATRPLRWTATEWATDLVPHLAFGIATMAAFDALKADAEPAAGSLNGSVTSSTDVMLVETSVPLLLTGHEGLGIADGPVGDAL